MRALFLCSLPVGLVNYLAYTLLLCKVSKVCKVFARFARCLAGLSTHDWCKTTWSHCKFKCSDADKGHKLKNTGLAMTYSLSIKCCWSFSIYLDSTGGDVPEIPALLSIIYHPKMLVSASHILYSICCFYFFCSVLEIILDFCNRQCSYRLN